MNKELKSEFKSAFLDNFTCPYTGSIYQWAAENVKITTGAVKGSFDISIFPYLRQPFDDLKDNSVHQINLSAAVQSGKTQFSEVYLPYIISVSPAETLRLHQSDDMARYFTETRLIPLLQNCKPTSQLIDNADRFAVKLGGITLPHMSLKIAGAKENVLHGSTIRYLLLDECWLYEKPDMIQKAKARTTAFGNNKKIVLTSQPGIEGDTFDKESTGKVFEWGWKCKECGNLQPWYWSKEKEDGSWAGIIWDKVYKDADSSSYDLERTGDTARLQCYHCTASYTDNNVNRKYLNDNGAYIETADHGNPKVKTYSWCGFVNTKITFKEKCIEYLQATELHKKTGLTDKLKLFRQQVLGQTWKRTQAIDVSKILVQTFEPDKEWPEEIFRCLSVDYQRKLGVKYWCVVAFSANEMRIVDHGYCLKWDDIHALAEKYKIPPPAVVIDSGFNASEVYLECYNHSRAIKMGKKVEFWGWTALKGDDADDGYQHKMNDGQKLTKYHSPMVRASIDNIKFARLFHWSNFCIKTIFYHIREGKCDMKMVLPKPDPEFDLQLNAESLCEVVNKQTGLRKLRWEARHDNNHYLDVCCQAIVAAMLAGKFYPDTVSLMQNVVLPAEAK